MVILLLLVHLQSMDQTMVTIKAPSINSATVPTAGMYMGGLIPLEANTIKNIEKMLHILTLTIVVVQ